MSAGVCQTGRAVAGSVLQHVQQGCASVCWAFRILATDLIPANVTCVIPNACSWAYRYLWKGSITSCSFRNTAGKVGTLFIHGGPIARAGSRIPAVLLLHGEHSHPLTMLHLADLAEREGRAVFSIALPYEDTNPENYRSLLRMGIDKVSETIAARGGILGDFKLVGHSRGAIEGASAAYGWNHPNITGVISIAGRFKVIDPSERPCRESFKPVINALWQRLRPSQPLRVPFYQIAAIQEWCIDPEASIVRTDHEHRYVDAGHLGVINHPDTLAQVKKWVAVPARIA